MTESTEPTRIDGIIIEPVGCLAKFRANDFHTIAAEVFDVSVDSEAAGSDAYWEYLSLFEHQDTDLSSEKTTRVEQLEIDAVKQARMWNDVEGALHQLNEIPINVLIASSLSHNAITELLAPLDSTNFVTVSTRNDADGVKSRPVRHAMNKASLDPSNTMFLTDSKPGLDLASRMGLIPMYLINDYEDGRRLVGKHNLTNGIISLHELPDALNLITTRLKQTE